MLNKYYRSKITGKIISNGYFINDIYGDGGIDKLIQDNVIEKIDAPSVEDIIKNGTEVTAVVRYRELHKCTLKEAKEAVDEMIQQYEEKSMKGESYNE